METPQLPRALERPRTHDLEATVNACLDYALAHPETVTILVFGVPLTSHGIICAMVDAVTARGMVADFHFARQVLILPNGARVHWGHINAPEYWRGLRADAVYLHSGASAQVRQVLEICHLLHAGERHWVEW